MADDAQPAGTEPQGTPQEPGQGAPAETDGGLYGPILDGIPNEYHEQLTQRLKENDAKATQRFQQLSERSKPFEDAGVFDSEPEQLQGWLNLSNALEAAVGGDQQAQQDVRQWWEGLGQQLGFDGEETGQESQAQDLLDLTPDKLQEMIAESVNPLVERFEQQEQQQQLDDAKAEIQGSLDKILKENPKLDREEDGQRIMALAYVYGQDSDDPVQAGFEEFKSLVARGESELFEKKIDQPAPAEGGGMPGSQATPVTSENSKELAMERLKQLQAT